MITAGAAHAGVDRHDKGTFSNWLIFTSQGRNMKNKKYVAGLDKKKNVIRVGQRMPHAPTASELGSSSPGKPM